MQWANSLIDELIAQGVTYFCMAPGSRNSPLLLAVARHPLATSFIHIDERGTSFHALGYAKAKKQPACIITTTGTATGNLLPAIMEAHSSHIPLIVLTADRPKELRDCGSNQTIDQVKLFSSFVRFEVDLPLLDTTLLPYLRELVAYATFKAATPPMGPIHINVTCKEPLYSPPISLPSPNISRTFHTANRSFTHLPPLPLTKRGVIVLGGDPIPSAPITVLAKKLGWPIFPDILSGVRVGVISHFELLLKAFDMPKVEAVLHFGGPFVSKTLLQWLSFCRPPLYAAIFDHPTRYDPLHTITHRFYGEIASFCEQISPLEADPLWLANWEEKNLLCSEVLSSYFKEDSDLTEPYFFHLLSQHMEEEALLFLGNSMPIRDASLFFHKENKTFANRGVSGIDGNIATAVGIACALEKKMVICIGDLAFLHDMNSLIQLQKAKHPITLFVFNNHGGGIFTHLPIREEKEHYDTHIRAKHPFTFSGIAKDFGLTYCKIKEVKSLQTLFKNFPNGHTLCEIITDDNKNHANLSSWIPRLQARFRQEHPTLRAPPSLS